MEKAKRILEVVKEALNQAPQAPQQQQRKPETTVQFDSQSDAPFNVVFSERGFSIDGTRMSFETIEDAISKQYTITLDNGQGRVLDGVLIQKILKYKSLYE
ncbi:MAG: hypothetical protein P8J32_02665 [bacterium]|nr:hypothetical protein [bacterium]